MIKIYFDDNQVIQFELKVHKMTYPSLFDVSNLLVEP